MAHAHPQPEIRNPDTLHETSDVNVRSIIWFVVVLTAISLGIQVAMYLLFVVFDKVEVRNEPAVSPLALPAGTAPPEPRLQTTPWADLKVLRADEANYLHGYGWIDEKGGVARVPIEKAKAMLLQKGIPVRPDLADPTEGTRIAATGGSNSARNIPAGQPDRSSGADVNPSATQAPGAQSGTGATGATEPAAAGARPETKPGGAAAKKPGGGGA